MRAKHDPHLELFRSLMTRREVMLGLGSLAFIGCGTSDTEVRAPLPDWNESIVNGYYRVLPDGTAARYITRRVGIQSVGATSYGRYRMERVGENAVTGAELWLNPEADGKITFGGGSYSSETAPTLGLPGAGKATLTAPVTVDLNAPVGQVQSFTLKADAAIGDSPITQSIEAVGSYTIAENDVSVQTSAGVIGGCSRVSVEGTVPLLFGDAPAPIKGQVWISKSLGVVKAQLDDPLAGFGMGVVESRGFHDLGGDYASVEAVGVVGNGATKFELSTTEAGAGALDADKETHAAMLIEMRWVDEATAKSPSQPMVAAELGTLFGVFPTQVVQSSSSFLHPDENGKGYVYWVVYANEAAKNELGSNGIAYHSLVTADASMSPVRVSSRIIYKRFIS
jgi:hypothetical protein